MTLAAAIASTSTDRSVSIVSSSDPAPGRERAWPGRARARGPGRPGRWPCTAAALPMARGRPPTRADWNGVRLEGQARVGPARCRLRDPSPRPSIRSRRRSSAWSRAGRSAGPCWPDLRGDDAGRALGRQDQMDAEGAPAAGDPDQSGDEARGLVDHGGELVDDQQAGQRLRGPVRPAPRLVLEVLRIGLGQHVSRRVNSAASQSARAW